MVITAEHTRHPLVVLAIDSADVELVRRWTAEGYLPTISRLATAGCFSEIDGVDLVNEMGSWISLYSGVAKDKHGFYSIRQLVPGSYELAQTTPDIARSAPPFWSFLQGGSKKAAIIDPAELDVVSGVPGIQLTNWAAHESERLWVDARSFPEHVLPEIMERFGSGEKLSTYIANATADDDHRDYERALSRIVRKGQVCRDIIARDEFDLIVATFFEAHTIGHRLWSYQLEFSDSNPLAHGLRDLYQAIDAELALILSELPEEGDVFVISPYGMAGQFPVTGLVDEFLLKLQYQIPQATGRLLGAGLFDPLTMMRRTLPTALRAWLSQHLPSRVQEQLIASDFATKTDWSRTLAFSIPSLYTGLIRLNVEGREPEGIVAPGAEYEELLDRLEVDLAQLIDPKTSQPAVKRVVRTTTAFQCGIDHTLPDLFVEWAWAPHFLEEVIHPKARLMQSRQHYHRSSFHRPKGFVAAAGPSIPLDSATRIIDVRDLAPTFLSLLDVPIPATMSGHSIFSPPPPNELSNPRHRCPQDNLD